MREAGVVDAIGGPGTCRGFVTELVLRCGRGDESALMTLLDLFHAPARACLARRVAADEVDDALVEAFARVWRAAPSFTPGRRRGAAAWVLDRLLWSPYDEEPSAA